MMHDPLTSAIDKEYQKMKIFATPPLQNHGFGDFAKCDFQMKLAVASGMTYITSSQMIDCASERL